MGSTENKCLLCDSCICHRLRKLHPNVVLDLIISGQEFASVRFICVDTVACCAEFVDGTSPLIFDCRQIQGFRVVT